MAVAGPKMAIWDFSLNFHLPYTFWGGVIGGAFLNTASHGVDQLIVQRLLAAKNERDSKIALLSSGVVIFFQFALFLLIGIMLYSFYHYNPGLVPPPNRDKIFPTFVVSFLPHGVRGIMVAAILAAAMSNLSSSLNALASTTVVDFYQPFLKKKCGRSGSIARLPLDHGLLGISAHAFGDSFSWSKVRAGSRTDHCLHNLWQHARSLSPRSADQKSQ